VKDIEQPERRFQMNSVTLTGHLGNAPTLGGENGTTFARLSLAVTTRYKKEDGERAERTDWLQVVAFDGVAKSIAELGKGDLVGVVGRLRTNTWEKDGVTRTTVEVVAQSVEFLRLKKDREAAQ
jgi:single-strand DNA-binding protein